jgi:hypothetical protein
MKTTNHKLCSSNFWLLWSIPLLIIGVIAGFIALVFLGTGISGGGCNKDCMNTTWLAVYFNHIVLLGAALTAIATAVTSWFFTQPNQQKSHKGLKTAYGIVVTLIALFNIAIFHGVI